MTIKDKGLMAFRSVTLLPQLTTNLRKYQLKEEYVWKSELDWKQLEYLNNRICESMEHNREVTITYFNKKNIEMTLGTIHYFHEMNKLIKVIDKFDECQPPSVRIDVV